MSLQVESRYKENIESLLRRFKRQMKWEGRMLEIREHEFYLKPSQKRKLKQRRKKTVSGDSIDARIQRNTRKRKIVRQFNKENTTSI